MYVCMWLTSSQIFFVCLLFYSQISEALCVLNGGSSHFFSSTPPPRILPLRRASPTHAEREREREREREKAPLLRRVFFFFLVLIFVRSFFLLLLLLLLLRIP